MTVARSTLRASVAALVYVHIGYPAVAWSASKLRFRRRRTSGTQPSGTTFVVCAFREAAVIDAKVNNTIDLIDAAEDRWGDTEIIVAIDGDDPATAAAVERLADTSAIIDHSTERRGKSAAINAAVTRSSGEIVVFTDANTFIDEDALPLLMQPFEDSYVGAVAGAKRVRARGQVGESDAAYWRYESAIKKWESRAGTTVAVTGELLAVRRSLIPELDPATVNDDFTIAMAVLRAGSNIEYQPEAMCWETISESLADEGERRRRIVAGRTQTIKAWRDTLPVRRPAVMAALVSHKFMRLAVPFLGAAAVAAAFLPGRHRPMEPLACVTRLATVALGAGALSGDRLAQRSGPIAMVAGLARYLVWSNVASAAGTFDGLRRAASPMWTRTERDVAELDPAFLSPR